MVEKEKKEITSEIPPETREPEASQQETLDKETPVELPPELQGKSKEQIFQMFENTKKKLGEQGDELGKMRDDVEYYRRKEEDRARAAALYDPYKQYNQPGVDAYGNPIYPQRSQEPSMTFDYEKPIESVEKVIEAKLKQREQYAQVATQQGVIADAKAAYQQGRNKAFQGNPDLYKGIERDVEQRIYDYYSPYAKQGISVSQFVGNPDIWRRAAQNIRLDKGENIVQIEKPRAMPATATETPSSARPATTEIPGQYDLDTSDPEVQGIMKSTGASPEEAKEIIKKEQERLFRGERW